MTKMSFNTQNLTKEILPSYDVPLSDEEKTYQSFLYYSKDDIIDDYNYMIDKVIPGILKRKFEGKNGEIIDVKAVSIKYPRIIDSKAGSHISTPRICRDTACTYQCDIYVDYIKLPGINRESTEIYSGSIETMRLGAIHCMVGSNRCYTSKVPIDFRSSDEWKMFLGECPSSPGGYFINKGGEKFVIHNDLLRTGDYISFMTKGDSPRIETRITCLNKCETSIVQLQIGKHLPNVKVLFPHLKGKHYPLYLTFFLLNYTYNNSSFERVPFNIEGFEDMIADFSEPEHRDMIKSYLEPSKLKFKKLFMQLQANGSYIILEDRICQYAAKKIQSKTNYIPEKNALQYVLNSISQNVPKEIFIGSSKYADKVANLCMMTCQIVLSAIGIRDLSSRDGWDKKKVDGPVRKISHYVSTVLVNALKNGKPADENISLGKGEMNDVVVESRKCGTINEAIGERDKISVRINARTTSKSIREVSQKQIPFICPVKTPEGETCGLSKEKSALMHLSLNREFEENRRLPIDDLFEPYIGYMSNIHDSIFAYFLIFVDTNNMKYPVKLGNDVNNLTSNVFFSLRILNILSKHIKSGEASYFIYDNAIYVKFKSQLYNCTYDTWTGLKLHTIIPQVLYEDFLTVCQRVKNPEYSYFSNLIMNDECKYKLKLTFSGNEGNYVMYTYNSTTFNIYVSDRFIEEFKTVMSKNDEIAIEVDTCNIIFKRYSLIHTMTYFKHWSEYPFVDFNVPHHYRDLFKRLLNTISDYFCTSKNKLYNYTFTFNGNVLTSPYNNTFYYTNIWVNGEKMTKYLKECRRKGSLPMDCCIHNNTADKVVQFNDDAGRVMSPLLVVDEDGQLVIDRNGSWKKFEDRDFAKSRENIISLYEEGSIELIDSKEMDTVLLAENPMECRRFYMLRKFLNSINITQLKSSIVITNEGNLINEDVDSVTIHGIDFNVEYVEKDPGFEVHAYKEVDSTYYGTYTFNQDRYTEYDAEIYRIDRPTVPVYRRDGMYMIYFKDNEWKFIYQNENPEFDNRNIYINDEPYKIAYIMFPKNVDFVYRDRNLCKLNLIKLDRPDGSDEETKYYFYNHMLYDESYIVDKHFLKLHDKTVIPAVVEFPAGKQTAFFEKNYEVRDRKKENKVTYKINEFIPADIKPNGVNFVEEKFKIDERECSLYVANIRRYQSDLDVIDFELDPNYILNKLKENIPEFGNRNILRDLRIYLNTTFKFTHSILDPNQCFSVIANFVPKADSNPGPRHTYQCAMGTQALGVNNSVWYTRYETSHKRLVRPCQHLFETSAELPLFQATMPVTQNLTIAVLAHRKTFEDPILMTRSAANKFGIYDKEVCIQLIEEHNSDIMERIAYPIDSEGNPLTGDIYRHLNPDGLPKFGSFIKSGDCIIGKMKSKIVNGKISNASYMAGVGDEGIVTDVKITYSEGESAKYKIITVKLKQYRHQQPGDKMASRFSQKGTIADIIEGMILSGDPRLRIIDDCKMPYVRGGPNHGLRPDIIFNPASFPSRMTCGLIKEIITAKAAYYSQEKVNASNFHHLDLDYYTQKLFEFGMDSNGNELLSHSDGEIMMDSTSNGQFQAFVGIVAYQFLKHHVIDKNSARYTGNVKPITHQPVEGRKNNGGHRMGEMERDAILSSGAGNILFDRFMDASDLYTDVYCRHCGNNSCMSNLERRICSICGVAGELVRVEEPRIYSVFCLQMNAIGCSMKFEFEPVDTFEEEAFEKQKQLFSDDNLLK